MRFRWPEGTVFEQLVLDVEQKCCGRCGGPLHVCAHRRHRLYTLRGPLELCCRLARCADPACPSRPGTLSPTAELSLALPGWLIGWDLRPDVPTDLAGWRGSHHRSALYCAALAL
jgi:hypothetical protein